MRCGAARTDAGMERGVNILMDSLPRWADPSKTRTVNFYYWYHATAALAEVANDARWAAWVAALGPALLDHQRLDGCARGSWDPVSEWSIVGGRVYATAMGVLTLERILTRKP